MPHPAPPADARRTAIRLLRFCVLCQCLGNAYWFGVVGGTPLFSVLWHAPDTGGLGWSEAAAVRFEAVLALAWIAAATMVVFRPLRSGALLALSLQAVVTLAKLANGGGYHQTLLADAGWWIDPLVMFTSQFGRLGVPLALALLTNPTKKSDEAGFQTLRWSAAVAFAAHGVKAIDHYPYFLDLSIHATRFATGVSLTESQSAGLLTVAGWTDLLVAAFILTRWWRWAAGYMALWGAATALARVLDGGPASDLWMAAVRAPHALGPAVLVVGWVAWKNEAPSGPRPSTEASPTATEATT